MPNVRTSRVVFLAVSIVVMVFSFGGCPFVELAPPAGWIFPQNGNGTVTGIVEISDGGFAIAGGVHRSHEAFVIRADAHGTSDWEKHFEQIEPCGMVTAEDGGFVVAGTTLADSFDTPGDIFLMKLDPDGAVLWSKTFGTAQDDEAFGMTATADGGYAIAGTTENPDAYGSFAYVVKTDAAGNLDWEQTYPIAETTEAHGIAVTADGGLVLCGVAEGRTYNAFVLKTDALGAPAWTHLLPDEEYGAAVVQTSDLGYMVMGTPYEPDENSHIYLTRLDADGYVLWHEVYWPVMRTEGAGLVQTSDGGFAVAGNTQSWILSEPDGVYLMKVDASGSLLWEEYYGGLGDRANTILLTGTGGFLLAGEYDLMTGQSVPYVLRTDASGEPTE